MSNPSLFTGCGGSIILALERRIEMREVMIKALLVDPSSNSPVVLLKDRPLTHALMKSMIEDLHATVERVLIKGMKDGTYFASIYVKDDQGDVLEFDARPSDSLALALRAGCPIYIADEVFESASIESPFAEEDEFGDFVEYDLDLGEFRRRSHSEGEDPGSSG
jgi:hypothetical protein